MVPPVSSSPAGSTGTPRSCHSKMVPPVGSRGRQDGATRRFVSCGVDREAQTSATLRFAVPSGWCHPSTRHQDVPRWGHPSDRARRIGRSLGPRLNLRASQTVPPPSLLGNGRLVPPSIREAESACQRARMVPPVGLSRWFVSSRVDREAQNRASLRFGVTPGRGHPPVRARQPGAKMVPPVGSVGPKQCHSPVFLTIGANTSWCHPSVCRTFGATPQSGWTEVASSILASPPRVAPVRPLWSIPSRHPTPLTVLAGAPERKASRLKKLSSPTR